MYVKIKTKKEPILSICQFAQEEITFIDFAISRRKIF